ncbi:hypothetical protein AZH51_17570 [Branchiibius sp. NY16-3462-2]|nr:hypothetical protein AZH51_17570 [Branchiibius sp. NY16-3462-2]
MARTLIEQADPRERSQAVFVAASSLERHVRLTGQAGEVTNMGTFRMTLGHILSIADWTETLTPTTWPKVFSWPLWMSRLSASIALASVAGRLLERGDEKDAQISAARAFDLARSAFPYAMGFYPPEAARAMTAVSYTACAAATTCRRAGDIAEATEILEWALSVLRFRRWDLTALRLPVVTLRALQFLATEQPEPAFDLLSSEMRTRGFRRLRAESEERIQAERILAEARQLIQERA